MEQKYFKGLLAGIAGGSAVSLIIVTQVGVDMLIVPHLYPGSSPGTFAFIPLLLSWLSYGLYGIILLLTGALAVWLARALLRDYSEALVVSGIAGVVTSVLWIMTNVLITLINDLLLFSSLVGSSMPQAQAGLGLIGAVVAFDLCCCGPAFLVFATVLALIGGGICGLIVVKK